MSHERFIVISIFRREGQKPTIVSFWREINRGIDTSMLAGKREADVKIEKRSTEIIFSPPEPRFSCDGMPNW